MFTQYYYIAHSQLLVLAMTCMDHRDTTLSRRSRHRRIWCSTAFIWSLRTGTTGLWWQSSEYFFLSGKGGGYWLKEPSGNVLYLDLSGCFMVEYIVKVCPPVYIKFGPFSVWCYTSKKFIAFNNNNEEEGGEKVKRRKKVGEKRKKRRKKRERKRRWKKKRRKEKTQLWDHQQNFRQREQKVTSSRSKHELGIEGNKGKEGSDTWWSWESAGLLR